MAFSVKFKYVEINVHTKEHFLYKHVFKNKIKQGTFIKS